MKSETQNLLDQAYENVGNLVKKGNLLFPISEHIYFSNFTDFTSINDQKFSDNIPVDLKVEKKSVHPYCRLVKAFNDFKNYWTQIPIPIFKAKNLKLKSTLLDLIV